MDFTGSLAGGMWKRHNDNEAASAKAAAPPPEAAAPTADKPASSIPISRSLPARLLHKLFQMWNHSDQKPEAAGAAGNAQPDSATTQPAPSAADTQGPQQAPDAEAAQRNLGTIYI